MLKLDGGLEINGSKVGPNSVVRYLDLWFDLSWACVTELIVLEKDPI